jgi:fused signal recognition particle receptor
MRKWFRKDKNKNNENNHEEVVETSEELVEPEELEPTEDLSDSDDADVFEETALFDESPAPEEEEKKKKRRWFRWGSVKETEEAQPGDFEWEESPEAEPVDEKDEALFVEEEEDRVQEEADFLFEESTDLKDEVVSPETGVEPEEIPQELDFPDESVVPESQAEVSPETGVEPREIPQELGFSDESVAPESQEAVSQATGVELEEIPQELDFSDESVTTESQFESMEPALEEELDFIFSEEDLAELTPEERKLKREGFFARLKKGLAKTRSSFASGVDRIIAGKKVIDEDLLDELEELLITADVGVKTTIELIRRIEKKVARKELSDPAALKGYLEKEIQSLLDIEMEPFDWSHKPTVIMVIGVNGTGKTTTIGKLAARIKKQGKTVLLVAGDTFRAAATEQLTIWAQRVGCQIIKQGHGADPSAVAFDGIQAGLSRGADVIIIDTAGRLHTKVNLMEELKKMQRVIGRQLEGAPHEVLLVLDATTGQNALSQAKMFNDAVGVTSLVLTKLDGTAKGGIVLAITQELNIPVRFIGVGEAVADLREFAPKEFAEAMFED